MNFCLEREWKLVDQVGYVSIPVNEYTLDLARVSARRTQSLAEQVGAPMPRILVIGGSDAGISAALRARELDSSADVTGDWRSEISKRVDVAAAALFQGAEVDDLNDMDLSYTAPFSSPWDPLQVAAQLWLRARSGA